ncbi:hypothetical protein F511_29297 [Dorcoceras hygrometricum]|uniref:Uncharacterized protein n=1 Tax=Dorcoceras hygrometricum TaxID=472368 RepID=A0A2Z7AVD4_9LAMI|nr:hypothetical protein F511_29297 [Dorcoceras hygrometricum]
MSLFDLQDVCIAVGSLATLDLPMVVDQIGIYVLKGLYCTLTTTNWFLQALSVIPRGSWGDVARRFTMIRWAKSLPTSSYLSAALKPADLHTSPYLLISNSTSRNYSNLLLTFLLQNRYGRKFQKLNATLKIQQTPQNHSTGCVLDKWVYLVTLEMSLFDLQDGCIVIGSLVTLDLPMVVDLIGICVERTVLYANHDQLVLAGTITLLVQTDEGLVSPVVDLIKEDLPPPTLKCQIPCESDRSQAPSRQHDLLVQTNEGLVSPVVDLIKEDLPPPTLKCQIPCESGRSQAPRRQQGTFAHSQTSEMASSSFTIAYLVDFESVLNIPDNEGMQNMFKTLESSGLRGFLGCKSVLCDPELEHVFDTALIQGGDITGAISGKYFSISPSRFAGVFELPTEGLSDFSNVPKNLVNDARKILSKSGEPVVPHGKKKLLKYEYRLLNDILAKSITILTETSKLTTDDAESGEQIFTEIDVGDIVFCDSTADNPEELAQWLENYISEGAEQMMTAIHFRLKVNWSKVLFGVLEEMVDRTVKKAKGFCLLRVLTYITTNQTADTRGQSDEGGKTPMATVKRASKSKKKSESTSDATVEIVSEVVGSKKRPAVEGSEPVVPKKRRTRKSKASVSSANLDMASVAQGVVPLQVIAPTPAVTAAQPPAPKRKSRKRKLILSEGSDDDNVEESLDVESVQVSGVNVQKPIVKVGHVSAQVAPSTDEVDDIIGQILTETYKLKTDDEESEEQHIAETNIADDFAQWLDDFVSRNSEPEIVGTRTVIDAEGNKSPVVVKEMNKAVDSKRIEEEHMSIDDLLLQISDDKMLPSVTAAEITKIRLGESISINEIKEPDLYFASLPHISSHDKGKEILEEDEPVKGNPARETVELICGYVDFLVQLRDKVMQDVIEIFHYFSLNKLSDIDSLLELKAKEKLMLEWAETDSLEIAVKRKVYILAKYREMLLRKFVESHRKYYTLGQTWTATASQIIDLLSDAHSKSLEDLIAQQKEHGLPMEQSCTSTFLDASVGGAAVLAQFFSQAKSTCWVRPMVLIDDVWTPIQGTDFWRSSCKLSLFVNRKKLPETVIEDNFVPHVFFIEPVQYWGAAPSLIKTWHWARVCTDVIRFSMFGCLRPVREDVCTDIVVYNFGVERIPASFRSIFQQGIYTDSFVGYFRDSDVQNLSDFQEYSSDGSTVYRSPSPLRYEPLALGPGIPTVAQEEQLYFVQSPESPPATSPCLDTSTSSTSLSMHFDADDIPLDDTADIQTSLPIADLLSLSTQLGDIVDYIRGGDAKKGEGSSSRRPLPTPVNQGESSGNVVRTAELSQRVIDNAQRDIVERMMTADRERERRERSRGSYRVDLIRVLKLLDIAIRSVMIAENQIRYSGYRVSLESRGGRTEEIAEKSRELQVLIFGRVELPFR